MFLLAPKTIVNPIIPNVFYGFKYRRYGASGREVSCYFCFIRLMADGLCILCVCKLLFYLMLAPNTDKCRQLIFLTVMNILFVLRGINFIISMYKKNYFVFDKQFVTPTIVTESRTFDRPY